MRPGSPVRSPAKSQLNYRNPSATHTAPAPATPAPAQVWVALATYTKAVQVNNTVATQPISGGPQGIFNRPQATIEQVNTAEVVAVCYNRAEAEAAVAIHKAAHAQLQAEYQVGEHSVAAPEQPKPAAPETYQCIGGCGRNLTGGVSYCEPCRQKLWASSGWRGDD